MPPENHRWVTGDQFGVAFPADPDGLRRGGPRFLTDAFRAAGVLGADNSVARIIEFREVAGGSTGRKVALAVEYDKAAPGLHIDLFATVAERTPLSADKLESRLTQLTDFVKTNPGLLPANARSPEFLARLRDDVPRIAHHEHTVAGQLAADADYVALCHWNANIDNAWFWRDADGHADGDADGGANGVLHCGLMDWACVSQMNMGMAIWEPCRVPKSTRGTTISTSYCSCSSRKSVAAVVPISIRNGCAGTPCCTRP